MLKKILLHNQEIEYSIKESQRAKRLRIAIYCDASVIVTLPNDFVGDLENFLKQKAGWILEKISYFKKLENSFRFRGGVREYKKYKNEAREFISERIERLNKVYGFSYNKIFIKNQKTRWGSCTRNGNLNFNYKIIYLPHDLADYIIAHELCHLKEFNHSRKFWNLVERVVPDFRERVNKLKNKYL